MADELAVEQKSPSKLPYFGVGAAAGAAAGYYGLPKIGALGRVRSHDDIIQEMNDKDTFAKNTANGAEHAKEWTAVKEKANVLEELKKVQENVAKAEALTGPEGDSAKEAAKTAFEEAKAKYRNILEKEGKTVADDAVKDAKTLVEIAEKELKETTKALAENLPKKAMKGWMGAIIGGLALGLAGLAIAPKNPKNT